MKRFIYGKKGSLLHGIPFMPCFPWESIVSVLYDCPEAILRGYYVLVKTNRELSQKEIHESDLEFIKEEN